MTRFIFFGIASGMALCALTLTALAYAPNDIPRPKPRPLMDCFVVNGDRVECEVRK